MRFVLCAGLAAGLLLFPAIASAQGAGHIYMEGRGGVTFLNDADNTGGGITVESGFDPGLSVAAAFGYADPSGFRGEIELGYGENEIDNVAGIDLSLLNASGDVSVFTALGNVYYDIKTRGPLTPFVGVGAGVANISVDGSISDFGSIDNNDDTVIAYQVGAGVAYALSPHWSFTLAYRFLATTDPEFGGTLLGSFESEYSSHNVLGGIRFTF